MAHVEFFGDLEGVARAKSELVAALPPTGVAVLNFDDPYVARMASVSPCPVLSYALGDADVRAERVVLDDDLRPRFQLSTPWGAGEVRLALHGMQQVPNALAAAAAALWSGVPFDGVVAALGTATGSPLRMEVRHVPGGPVLVVDCYNANPASTEAALRSLASLPSGRKLAVLGLMAELGSETEAEHRRAARLADELGIEVVGYQTALYGPAQVSTVDDAVALLLTLGPGDAALVKGSRVARLEDVVRRYGEAGGRLVAAVRPGTARERRRAARHRRGPDATARRRGTPSAPTAIRPGPARRPGAGTPATPGGDGPRHLLPQPAAWRSGRAPRCRARRSVLARVPTGPDRRARRRRPARP